MSLSQEEIQALVDKFQGEFVGIWMAKDAEKAAALHHPDGVLIEAGGKVYHGREALVEFYQDFFNLPWTFSPGFDKYCSGTPDGQFLVLSEHSTVDKGDGVQRKFHFEQILKREPDGRYLVYHDVFKFL